MSSPSVGPLNGSNPPARSFGLISFDVILRDGDTVDGAIKTGLRECKSNGYLNPSYRLVEKDGVRKLVFIAGSTKVKGGAIQALEKNAELISRAMAPSPEPVIDSVFVNHQPSGQVIPTPVPSGSKDVPSLAAPPPQTDNVPTAVAWAQIDPLVNRPAQIIITSAHVVADKGGPSEAKQEELISPFPGEPVATPRRVFTHTDLVAMKAQEELEVEKYAEREQLGKESIALVDEVVLHQTEATKTDELLATLNCLGFRGNRPVLKTFNPNLAASEFTAFIRRGELHLKSTEPVSLERIEKMVLALVTDAKKKGIKELDLTSLTGSGALGPITTLILNNPDPKIKAPVEIALLKPAVQPEKKTAVAKAAPVKTRVGDVSIAYIDNHILLDPSHPTAAINAIQTLLRDGKIKVSYLSEEEILQNIRLALNTAWKKEQGSVDLLSVVAYIVPDKSKLAVSIGSARSKDTPFIARVSVEADKAVTRAIRPKAHALFDMKALFDNATNPFEGATNPQPVDSRSPYIPPQFRKK
ncbi:MAG: hypothetical protein WCV91_03305 [Candidatus Margulisiibacteriota bacterium]